MPLVLLEKECGPKCKSRKHVLEIISFIVRGSLKEFQAYSRLCHNWAKNSDIFGRTALHVAASCGKVEILKWLLEENLVDVNVKDLESGYTALHRSILYGQLGCARLLVQFNADVQVRDVEGLSPLDIAMLDRHPEVVCTEIEPNDAYTWGENNNSTLGHASPHKRTSPEAVDFFKKMGISLKQIVLCKYHCVFLTQSGKVYTCGHGQGGRLGHGDQHTVLVPRLLESVKEYTCLGIAAANDHTVLRMEGSIVFTYGLNMYQQLGQTPIVENSLIPKQMNLKPLKGKTVSGVCVGRFHSVVWTLDGVYTVGLNAGQLGHLKGEKFVSQLRQVSYLRHTDIGIARVTCSDAAIVCLTTKGDVYLLHEYQCKKIVTKGHEIDKVMITGGNLDYKKDSNDLLTEKGGAELHIMLKNESGQLFSWKTSEPTLKKCIFALKRQLDISDVAMTTSCLLLSTKRGEAFIGYFSNKKTTPSANKDIDNKQTRELVKECGDGFGQTCLHDRLLKQNAEEIQVRRLPVLHRAVVVSADRKGRNFAVLQSLPNSCMSELPFVTSSEMNIHFDRFLSEADLEDNIHDVVIQIGNSSWPVHKYIIAMRSDVLHNMVTTRASVMGEKMLLKLDAVSPEAMHQLISFMYTDMCDYLQPGFKVRHAQALDKERKPRSQGSSSKPEPDTGDVEELIFTKGLSAFQVQEKKNLQKGKKKEPAKVQSEAKDTVLQRQDVVKMLQEAARKLGVKGLSKRLESVKCTNDVILAQGKSQAKPKVKFDRSKLPELYDVHIKPEDGPEIHCHKCVLVARLEYFHSMLATGWVETLNTTTLALPIPADVLRVLVDYLYTDEALELKDCVNEDLLCNVLIVSDQLLAWRLKEMCEVALANTIAFRNVCELLEFSSIYNAEQLKASCQEFISINLSAMIECRYLDVLSEETLSEVTAYYRSITPSMAYRLMTPDIDNPPQSYIEDLVAEFESLDTEHQNEHALAKKGKQQQRKRSKPKKPVGSEAVEKVADVGPRGDATPRKAERTWSVGSDRSTKSEDGFHSMVEELNRQAEEDEKKLAAAMEKTRQMRRQAMNLGGPAPVASLPTQPEDIPRWTSSYQPLAWTGNSRRPESAAEVSSVSPSPSPLSPSLLATSPTSFRDILQQESKSADRKKSAFPGRVSWRLFRKQPSKDEKDKQPNTSTLEAPDNIPKNTKEAAWKKSALSGLCSPGRLFRKQQSKDEKEKQPNTSTPEAPDNIPKNTKEAAWGSVGGAVTPFRDLMIEDRRVSSAPIAAPPRRGPARSKAANNAGGGVEAAGELGKSPPSEPIISWGLSVPIGRSGAQANTEAPRVSTSLPTEAENPWQRRATQASSPPAQAPITAIDFSAIMRDEKEKSDTLVRVTQKPLALIQLEEKAMAELLAHYADGRESDHYITVERVSKQMAAPVWHREQKSSSSTGHL